MCWMDVVTKFNCPSNRIRMQYSNADSKFEFDGQPVDGWSKICCVCVNVCVTGGGATTTNIALTSLFLNLTMPC